jgi:hypothetical protein
MGNHGDSVGKYREIHEMSREFKRNLVGFSGNFIWDFRGISRNRKHIIWLEGHLEAIVGQVCIIVCPSWCPSAFGKHQRTVALEIAPRIDWKCSRKMHLKYWNGTQFQPYVHTCLHIYI